MTELKESKLFSPLKKYLMSGIDSRAEEFLQ